MSESKVKYHRFTGAIPVIFTEDIPSFMSRIDPSIVSEAENELSSPCFKEVSLPGLKFLVFSESMLRTLYGPRKVNLAVECTLAIWKGLNKHPEDSKAAYTEAIRLAKKFNRKQVYEILKSRLESKFGSIDSSEFFVKQEDKSSARSIEKNVFSSKINEAGDAFERQEKGLVDVINRYASKGPISVRGGSVTIKGVTGAQKFGGTSSLGKEPYTDVILKTKGKPINVSNKGTSAPSLAGGGRLGIETVLPGLLKTVLTKANTSLKKKYSAGEKIPDVYFKLDPADALKLVRGTKDIGGPIDYMYVGPMDVSHEWDASTKTLTLNGSFSTPQAFTRSHELYIRLRKRREDQPYDPDIKDKFGYPGIMGKSPSKGDTLARIVVTDKISGKGIVLK